MNSEFNAIQHLAADLVSVIIPVHNRMELFAPTLESVYKQTYRPLEVWVINDGSSYAEEKVLEKIISGYKGIDPAFGLNLISTQGKGAPYARNLGFENATGSFIQFLDSDDLLLPQKIKDQVSILKKDANVDLTYSKAQFVDKNLIRKNEFWGKALEGDYRDCFLFPWQTMCPLYRKEAILKFGLWDEALVINQDWEFSLRYIIKGATVDFRDEVQSLFRQHELGNIGARAMSIEKVRGKLESTDRIYYLLIQKGMMGTSLKKMFVKRWIYLLLLASRLGAGIEFNRQISLLKKKLPIGMHLLFLPLRWRWLSTFILDKYLSDQKN